MHRLAARVLLVLLRSRLFRRLFWMLVLRRHRCLVRVSGVWRAVKKRVSCRT